LVGHTVAGLDNSVEYRELVGRYYLSIEREALEFCFFTWATSNFKKICFLTSLLGMGRNQLIFLRGKMNVTCCRT